MNDNLTERLPHLSRESCSLSQQMFKGDHLKLTALFPSRAQHHQLIQAPLRRALNWLTLTRVTGHITVSPDRKHVCLHEPVWAAWMYGLSHSAAYTTADTWHTHDSIRASVTHSIKTQTMTKSAWELCFGCMLCSSWDGRLCVSLWERQVSVMVLVWWWACIVLLSEGLTAALCASNMRSDSLTTIANDGSVVLSCPDALCASVEELWVRPTDCVFAIRSPELNLLIIIDGQRIKAKRESRFERLICWCKFAAFSHLYLFFTWG